MDLPHQLMEKGLGFIFLPALGRLLNFMDHILKLGENIVVGKRRESITRDKLEQMVDELVFFRGM